MSLAVKCCFLASTDFNIEEMYWHIEIIVHNPIWPFNVIKELALSTNAYPFLKI